MPNWKKVIVSGSDAILNQITASSGLDTTDVTIDGWGSVSSSLASIESSGSSQTLQQVTDNGSTTTNSITVDSTIHVGKGGGSISTNTAVGNNALGSNSTGNNNSSFGKDSLSSITDSHQNVAFGVGALRDLTYIGTTGNTAIGYQALRDSTGTTGAVAVGMQSAAGASGDYFTAVGYQSLLSATGDENTALGYRALKDATSADQNTAVGTRALQDLTTGDNNTAIGKDAGLLKGNGGSNLTSANGVFLGYNTKPATQTSSNEIVIGYNTVGGGSNTVTIGNSSITNNYFSGDISGSDVTIDDWGSVSSSLASINSSIDNYGEWNLAGEADTTDVTSQKFVKFTGGQSITGTGTEANPYVMTIVPSSLGNTTTIDSTSDAQLILDRAANSNDSEILFKTNGTTNWSIGTGQVGGETEFTFKGQDGANYIRINQSGQADFLSAVTASAVHVGDYTEIESNRLTIADGADATVTQLAVATYCGVFVDYTIYSTDAGQTNMRTGTYRAVFNDSEVQDSETMTNDIGDTNGFVLSVSLDGTNFTLTANNDIGQQCRVSYTVKPIKL